MSDSRQKRIQSPFVARHIGPSSEETTAMLEAIGCRDLGDLIDRAMPRQIRQHELLRLGDGCSEAEAIARLRRLAAKNCAMVSLIGQGYHGTLLPPVIQRNVLENPAWYTAYTPYQAEISQGRLEALLNFQTMVSDLTGLPVANASLLDEASAAAEAMTMAQRAAKGERESFFADRRCHPQILSVLRTRAEPLGWSVVVGDPSTDLDPARVFGALFQYPDTTGGIIDPRPFISQLHDAGAVACMAVDLLAMTLLVPPGELGADVAIGSSQRFGMPMGFGGPHAAFIACSEPCKRILPGRLVGVSVDSRGRRAYRLALQTREQHIRREKATSNICTAQVLPAVVASMYAVYHGPDGLRAIAERVHSLAADLARRLDGAGFALPNTTFFDTLQVDAGPRAGVILQAAAARGINLRDIGRGLIGITVDETTTPRIVDEVTRAFGAAESTEGVGARRRCGALPASLERQSPYLTHPVFNEHRSETNLLRYIRRLSDVDLALDRTMIPLGSCTMKLNATAEMMPITWPGFAEIHPYAPFDQVSGYRELAVELSEWLCEITGYDAVSLQPNSGAQGELAGLLAIRAYLRSRDQDKRTLCLIPSSAHGTNPASAQMAGMDVEIVRCDAEGNVDLADLESKAAANAERLAAVMVTYPSTHGVFEEGIRELCDIVHRHGGQVYLDGANLNAQVGLVRPGELGADVSHLNLHKTFCIPHGGGGPGMGPVAVKSHLAPFLPGSPLATGGLSPVGPVTASPLGSAAILPISYAYILMMGSAGLRRATEIAILNANYVAARLHEHFPVLYRNGAGFVAHECIIDPRRYRDAAGVTVDDIAKRLIDYGFHAPTMSFPVAGTLMVEPTESESKAELDRFIEAMIAIRREIGRIEAGGLQIEESPLRHAPHTLHDLTDEAWQRRYSRAEGISPAGLDGTAKYIAPVNRIDNVHGDRNLVCTCPPPESYLTAAERTESEWSKRQEEEAWAQRS